MKSLDLVFDRFDTDKNGTIDRKEMVDFVRYINTLDQTLFDA